IEAGKHCRGHIYIKQQGGRHIFTRPPQIQPSSHNERFEKGNAGQAHHHQMGYDLKQAVIQIVGPGIGEGKEGLKDGPIADG
ncbi:hypothetical protein, partial [Aeromonas veronii]|uniref:hypothetical protein n=1 Tax=Aeromonas veronii TaxID=654 RepID=UPI0038B5D9BF